MLEILTVMLMASLIYAVCAWSATVEENIELKEEIEELEDELLFTRGGSW